MTCLARYLVQPLRGAYLTIRIQTRQSASSEEKKKCHCNQSPVKSLNIFLLIMMIFPFAALLLSHFLEMHDVYNEPSVDKGTSVCHTHSTPHRPPLRTLHRTAVYGVRQNYIYWIKNKQLILFHICRQTCLNHDREEQRKVQHKKMCYT